MANNHWIFSNTPNLIFAEGAIVVVLIGLSLYLSPWKRLLKTGKPGWLGLTVMIGGLVALTLAVAFLTTVRGSGAR
jgi:hypothetical protein